jgi:hypothetical protein
MIEVTKVRAFLGFIYSISSLIRRVYEFNHRLWRVSSNLYRTDRIPN